jgi:hypothetical protein
MFASAAEKIKRAAWNLDAWQREYGQWTRQRST